MPLRCAVLVPYHLWAINTTGDVLTRLSKLGVDKRRAAIGRVRDEMYLEEEEQMAGFTIDERSQELAVRRCAQGRPRRLGVALQRTKVWQILLFGSGTSTRHDTASCSTVAWPLFLPTVRIRQLARAR